MSNFFGRFRSLQWKLTLSYTWVTAGVALAIFLLILLAAASIFGWLIPNAATAFQPVLQPTAPRIAQFLQQTPPDILGLRAWLDSSQQGNEFLVRTASGTGTIRFSEVSFAAVVDPQGALLALEPGGDLDQAVAMLLFPAADRALTQALRGETEADRVTAVDEENNDIFIAVPVFAAGGEVLAVFILVMDLPANQSGIFSVNTVLGLLPLVIFVFLVTGLIGTIFGFIASRSLSRRLGLLAETAAAWSEGDFSAYVTDASGDEIGQLARRLNQMAAQLQNLMQTQADLATLEERNRLARDLHDSVKQQVFATAMQLGAAKTMLDSDPSAARTHLQEAEKLAQQAQKELTGLIQELRPAALAKKSLVEALRVYADDWSRQTGISAHLAVHDADQLPREVEQALYRLAQEALANVARHSKAQSVNIQLVWQPREFSLTITDDGQGFDQAEVVVGMGLNSMQERLAQLNGRLSISSKQGQGTQLMASVPLEKRKKEPNER